MDLVQSDDIKHGLGTLMSNKPHHLDFLIIHLGRVIWIKACGVMSQTKLGLIETVLWASIILLSSTWYDPWAPPPLITACMHLGILSMTWHTSGGIPFHSSTNQFMCSFEATGRIGTFERHHSHVMRYYRAGWKFTTNIQFIQQKQVNWTNQAASETLRPCSSENWKKVWDSTSGPADWVDGGSWTNIGLRKYFC